MGLGMVLAWIVAPGPLVRAGLVPEMTFNSILQRWIMWPGTGLMVAGGLAALALKWKVIAKTFQALRSKDVDAGGDFPMKWVIWGAIACTVVLAAVQKISVGFPIWLSLVSVFLSLIVGSTDRNLTILQLIGVPIGALAVAGC
jgi:hypothetical protein